MLPSFLGTFYLGIVMICKKFTHLNEEKIVLTFFSIVSLPNMLVETIYFGCVINLYKVWTIISLKIYHIFHEKHHSLLFKRKLLILFGLQIFYRNSYSIC